MSTGSEWASEGWSAKASTEDQWKIADSLGRIVRLRMKATKDVMARGEEATMIQVDVEQVWEDGTGFDSWQDAALWGAWFLSTFTEHLPYTALGVVEEVKTDKGHTMRQLRPLTDAEHQLAMKALDTPAF